MKTALRTRVLVVGVFVGALVAMSLSWVFSLGPVEVETEAERAHKRAEAALMARRQAFSSPPGSCLSWTASDASDVKKVPCTSEHLFEVVGVVDISKEFPRGARQPSTEHWRTITEDRCGETAREYLGKPLDPYGKLSLGVLRPDDEQWAEGHRKLHCGLQWVAPGGELQVLTEPAAEVNQSNVWEPGTCLGLQGKTVGDPVDCSQEHAYEMVGLVDLAKEFDEYPPEEEQMKFLDRRCSRIAEKYTGGTDLREQGLILTWDLRERESWEAGSTLVNCKVGAKLKDNSGLAPVRGSVAAQPDTPEPSEPAERPGPGEASRSAEPDQPADSPEQSGSTEPAEQEPSSSSTPDGE